VPFNRQKSVAVYEDDECGVVDDMEVEEKDGDSLAAAIKENPLSMKNDVNVLYDIGEKLL
jgi:hypothetical protein